jgi:NarL family two-component system response regulator LiaR
MTSKSKKPKLIIPRVVIADDHDLFREILTLTLEGAGMDVVHAASTGREAVDAVNKHNPDLVILDVVMPEMDGLAALSVIKFMFPEIPVVMITALVDPLYLARAGELGADGYYSKGVEADELIAAIHSILAGEKPQLTSMRTKEPVPPAMPGFAFPKEEPKPGLAEELTEQEGIILSLIAMGLENQEITEKLHVTRNTLKTHTRNIYSKLGVSDRTQAAIWALQNGYHVGAPAEFSLVDGGAK